MERPVTRLRLYAFPSALAVIFLCWLGGFVMMTLLGAQPGLANWLPVVWVLPAAFGGYTALRFVGAYWRERTTLAHLPQKVTVDMEAGVAFVTSFDGTISTVEVPEEIREQGPEAVQDYVWNEVVSDE
jgi:hypothetical protein